MIPPRLDWLLPEPIPDPPVFAGFGPAVATLLARRGIRDQAALDRFLEAGPSSLHPVSLMADAERALDRVDRAIERGERIAIWGDYDADGMSAVAVWVLALRALGVEAVRHVPSRWSEGYGLSAVGLERLRAAGVDLVVTCDCGIANVAEVDHAATLGLDVIVTDHHLPGPVLPRAVAVVDPHRPECAYPDADLTGAGLAFKLTTALLARRGMAVPDLAGVAAIGTMADLAPMTGESRAIVQIGLGELSTTRRAGLRAMVARAADEPGDVTSRDLAFGIAPLVNAAGRIAEAELAIGLLVEEDAREASRLVDELEAVQQRRRELTGAALAEARGVLGGDGRGRSPLLIRGDAWAPGIIGLLAGRLADELGRPVAVVSAADGELRGSVRAVDGFHVAAALEACADHLTKRGGHAGAGGFSLAPSAWDAFERAFSSLPVPFPAVGQASPSATPSRGLTVDLVLPARLLTWDLSAQLARLAPYGPGNAQPVLAVTGLRVSEARRVGSSEAHIAFRMRRGLEAFDAVAFGAPAERPLPERGSAVDLVGTLERDRFQGIERLRLRVHDYADAAASPLLTRRLPRSESPAPVIAAAAG